MDDEAARIQAAGAAIEDLREPLESGEPWPLSDVWGTEDEAHWGPPEVLAHVAEMLTYWHAELGRVAAGDGTAPVPFGRVASDPSRLARIDELRRRPTPELVDEIGARVPEVAGFVSGLSPDDADRVGLHPTRGELRVGEGVERFFANHLEEHVAQLQSILDRAGA
ncbi:MAG TPA: DinB family protein [Candidatus Limnocylindrales bacterium]|nr:DinB family protein [Candidatus Limnocylindrales bacterium]